jgi:hypothetical protein
MQTLEPALLPTVRMERNLIEAQFPMQAQSYVTGANYQRRGGCEKNFDFRSPTQTLIRQLVFRVSRYKSKDYGGIAPFSDP